MRHEVGHDMIAKGEVNINQVRQKIKDTFKTDKEVDQIAEYYATAYAMSTSTAEDVEAIWEEVICDSLADMNVFSGSKMWAEAAEHMGMTIPAVQKAVSEGKANQTRGSPEAEGKASREFENRKKKGKVQPRDDFATNAMIWAFSSSTRPGDTKVLYDAKNSTWNQLVAENTEERYSILVSIEDTAENAEAIRNLYNEVYNENNRTQQRNGDVIRNDYERYWSFSNNGGNDNVNVERQITNGQTGNVYGKESDGNRNTNIQQSSSNSKQVKYSRELDTDYLDAENEVKVMSNRELLVNSLETTAQNEAEKEKLAEYKGRIDMLNAEEKKLAQLKGELKELTFGKGEKCNNIFTFYDFLLKNIKKCSIMSMYYLL